MTEKELINGCIKKNTQCQRMLFDMYAGKMLSLCRRYATDLQEAEDILQEAFIKLFSHIEQFKHEGSFEGWIRRIVINTALKILQKKRLRFDEVKDHHAAGQVIETSAISRLNAEELIKLINRLPDGYRIVFNLSVIEGYSHDEIAEMLNIQPSTSRSQLVKARKMLQEQIKVIEKIAL